MAECNEQLIDAGIWMKDDDVSELELQLLTRDLDGKPVVMDITDATSIKLEMRSLDRPGATGFEAAFTIVDIPTARVKLVDPGANWTPVTGQKSERFEGFPRINKPSASGWAKDTLLVTLRTAP